MSHHFEDDSDVGRALYRPVRRSNALENTVSRLVQTIRLGVVEPGASLPPERELAQTYGVSRDTVREAIRELTAAGYVVARRGRYGGTFVVDPVPHVRGIPVVSPQLLDDVLGFRQVLEEGSARLAATQELDEAGRAELWEQHIATSEADTTQYRRLDTALHLSIATLAGVPSILRHIVENRTQVTGWLDAFPIMPRNIEHSNELHGRIVRAIISRNPDEAARAMREHVAGSEALIRGFLS